MTNRMQSEMEEADILQEIRDAGLNLGMPAGGYSDRILKRLQEEARNKRLKLPGKVRRPLFARRMIAVTVASAMLCAGIVGSGFVSPVMAAALRNIPVVGGLFQDVGKSGLKKASEAGLTTVPEQQDAQDEITITISEVAYDGIRLSMAIEREGAEGLNMVNRDRVEEHPAKGYLGYPEMYLGDTKIGYRTRTLNEIASTDQAGKVGFSDKILIAEFENLSRTDGGDIPDDFEMRVLIPVTGIEQPYEFVIPVKKMLNGITLSPEKSQSNDEFAYTVQKVILTPAMTKLIVDTKGFAPDAGPLPKGHKLSAVHFEIINEQGEGVEQEYTTFEHGLPPVMSHSEETYAPFDQRPKKLIIKPYAFIIGSDWLPVLDENGNDSKVYYDDLELKIDVKL
ncbi:DUF4179 domain-containing protein [Paenibacillus sp. OK076]|uniref:DUF4179 domain-containing protein n=1 Tax=Paenibacillus sp. OK076 TaxID=1884379 RepID=UPI0008AF608D|nr:DUF4179 domain-containing protein [Paenibacillus sp. OK076]SEM89165.1 protein of unknown function [Paenibacillus sp. OK076]